MSDSPAESAIVHLGGRSTVSGNDTAETRAGMMLALLERPEWHRRAACRGVEGFFDLTPLQAIGRHCIDCPVIWHCHNAGEGEPYGIWGGEEKPGLEPETLDDRIIALVCREPFTMTRKAIEASRLGARVDRVREVLRRLVVEDRITQHRVKVAYGWARVYGPGGMAA